LKEKIILLTVITILMMSCPSPSSSGGDSEDSLQAGDTKTFSADSISFRLKYCPGGTFDAGALDDNDLNTDGDTDDSGEGVSQVVSSFWLGETEVTYELWYAVLTWASGNGYNFENSGKEGNDGTEGAASLLSGSLAEPVTTVSWRDVMVFCNALTEWYNEKTGSSLTTVYNSSGTPIRDSRSTNSAITDAVTADTSKTGFRLLSSLEWECAARYINGSSWTAGANASGATNDYTNSTATGNVAVYGVSNTAAIKSKNSNALGCYDMSGNVFEWCFDWHPDHSGTHKFARGGGYGSINYLLAIGFAGTGCFGAQDATGSDLGLRISCTSISD